MLIETILIRPYQIQFEHSVAATNSGQSNAILINRYTLSWKNQIDETDPNCSKEESYSQSSEYLMTHWGTYFNYERTYGGRGGQATAVNCVQGEGGVGRWSSNAFLAPMDEA